MPDDLNFDPELANFLQSTQGGPAGMVPWQSQGPYEGADATGPQLPVDYASAMGGARRRGLAPKMRAALMVVVRQMGVVAALYLLSKLGYDVQTGAAALLSGVGRKRGRGISFRQLSNARRVNRTISSMYHSLHAGGGHRRRGPNRPFRRRRRR